jgi:radical SAM protein with 4Fe4S-binding SPASM domain
MLHSLDDVCVEVTNRCLCYCRHCSSEASIAGFPNELTLDEIKNIIDQAALLSASTLPGSTKDLRLEELVQILPKVAWDFREEEWIEDLERQLLELRETRRGRPILALSGGEPLLRPDIREIATYGKQKGFKIILYTAAVTAPGRGLAAQDAEQWAAILDEDDRVAVSIEGANAVTFEAMTGVKGHFQIVMDAIELLRRHKIIVTAHCTPTKLNYREVPALVKLAAELGVTEVAFLRLVPQGRALENYDRLRLNRGEFRELQEIMTEEWKRGERGGDSVKIRWGCPIDFRHLLYPIEKRPCHGGRDTLVVRPNGEVHPCPAWKDIDELSLGNARTDSLAGLWLDSEVLNLFRQFTPDDLQGECYWCANKALCGGGCPAQRILANQTRGIKDKRALLAVGPDPLCFRELL